MKSLWNNEEFPQHWQEYIPVIIYKMADKTDCNSYRRITLLPTSLQNCT